MKIKRVVLPVVDEQLLVFHDKSVSHVDDGEGLPVNSNIGHDISLWGRLGVDKASPIIT